MVSGVLTDESVYRAYHTLCHLCHRAIRRYILEIAEYGRIIGISGDIQSDDGVACDLCRFDDGLRCEAEQFFVLFPAVGIVGRAIHEKISDAIPAG